MKTNGSKECAHFLDNQIKLSIKHHRTRSHWNLAIWWYWSSSYQRGSPQDDTFGQGQNRIRTMALGQITRQARNNNSMYFGILTVHKKHRTGICLPTTATILHETLCN